MRSALNHALALSLSCAALAFATLIQASEQPALNVYTYDSFVSDWGPGPALEKAFEAQCQCDLSWIAVEDGVSVLNRARIEQDKTKADLLLGLDTGLIEQARSLGLVQPHGLATDRIITELNWSDSEFIPFDYGYFAFIYDSTRIDNPPRSLEALVNSDAQIIYQDPRTSTPGQGLMIWMNQVFGDQTAQAWQKLSTHTVTVTKGWWEAYSMFLEGGSDYVLSYTTSPAYHQVVEQESKYRAAEFSEGHIAQIEVAAISRFSDQPELSARFLEFLISDEAQAIIATTNWMLPVVNGVELPEAFNTLITPAQIPVTPQMIDQQRAEWINTWRRSAQ